MKISARNSFSGTVRNIVKGPVSAEITVELASGVSVVAVISTVSAENLGLAPGKRAYVFFKASSVLVGTD